MTIITFISLYKIGILTANLVSMIQKYFSIAIILMSILVVSCRQDNEINNQNEENSFLKKEGVEGALLQRPDSLNSPIDPISPTDPPKNGTHYKFTDSLSLNDNSSEPPKNGTHYKSK